ncbi:hypothetical protein N431DRAFT_456667 [Stipitochalara longipes BDJ]|nr:hypothetical protein N431DRAFT_456667 [Stipitochalara longipes BDJ]
MNFPIPLGAFDTSVHVDYNNTQNDRFTTYWTGLFDERAIQYAAKHGSNYNQNGTTGNLTLANRAADDEVRAEHARDIGLDTGTTIIIAAQHLNRNWAQATLGQKLRTSASYRSYYESMRTGLLTRKATLEGILSQHPVQDQQAKELRQVNIFLEFLNDGLSLVDQLERLVLDEMTPGCNWRVEIPRQLAIRAQQSTLHKDAMERAGGDLLSAM